MRKYFELLVLCMISVHRINPCDEEFGSEDRIIGSFIAKLHLLLHICFGNGLITIIGVIFCMSIV